MRTRERWQGIVFLTLTISLGLSTAGLAQRSQRPQGAVPSCDAEPVSGDAHEVGSGLLNTADPGTSQVTVPVAVKQIAWVVLKNLNALGAPLQVTVTLDGRPLCQSYVWLPPMDTRTVVAKQFGSSPTRFQVSVGTALPGSNAIASVKIFSVPPPKYRLRLFNVDDHASAMLAGQTLITCHYLKDCSVDLNPYLKKGNNSLNIQLVNDGGGYAYAWVISVDGESWKSNFCGDAGRQGCRNDSRKGVVYTESVPIPFW